MGCRVVIVYTPAEKRGGGYLIGVFVAVAAPIRRAIVAAIVAGRRRAARGCP